VSVATSAMAVGLDQGDVKGSGGSPGRVLHDYGSTGISRVGVPSSQMGLLLHLAVWCRCHSPERDQTVRPQAQGLRERRRRCAEHAAEHRVAVLLWLAPRHPPSPPGTARAAAPPSTASWSPPAGAAGPAASRSRQRPQGVVSSDQWHARVRAARAEDRPGSPVVVSRICSVTPKSLAKGLLCR
jgi:hypothetical protein